MTERPLVSTEDLKQWTGYERPSAIKKWLEEKGISYIEVAGNPVTTVEQINAALNTGPEQYEFH